MKQLLFVITMFCALSIEAKTFVKVDDVRYLIEDDHAVVARQDRELTGDIVIPNSIEYNEVIYNVTRLMSPSDSESGGGGAFQECEITGITLPEAITEIPDQTFYECRQLSSVTFNGVVTSIGRQAFMLCEALSTIELTDAVTEIGEQAFRQAGLTEFTIPAGVTELKYQVLSETKIAYIEIPATVITLGNECLAYRYNEYYKTYGPEWPSERTIIMNHRDCRTTSADINTFGDMTIVNLQVPAGSKAMYQEHLPWMRMKSITEFGEEPDEPIVPDQRHVTIDGICYLLKDGEAQVAIQPKELSGEVVIPEQVTYEDVDYPVTGVIDGEGNIITYMWFKPRTILSQTAVTKITLPSSIKTIGQESFRGSPDLQEVVLNEGLTDIGYLAFSDCEELTSISIPSSVTILPWGILGSCRKLKTLSLPEGIIRMEQYALADTDIETLSIPSTCTEFGISSLQISSLKTLYFNVKEPTEINGGALTTTIFGHESREFAQEYLSNIDLIVPLGCAESYKELAPWFYCRSVTEDGSPYLKLNNSVFSAPNGAFTVTNTENGGVLEFEEHSGEYEESYTHGLCLKEGTTVSFSTTAENSQVYVYLFSNNSSTVKLDDTEISVIGDDQSATHSYRRYDIQVGAGTHTITCNPYEGDEWPCMFLLQVQNISGDYYQPKKISANINGVTYILKETVNELEEIVRTATIACQNPSLSGDIVIPEKVSYAKKVLQDDEWVTLDAHDYDVTDIVLPGFEISVAGGEFRTTGGAFQESLITSISLPSTISGIPSGTFYGCTHLKSVTLDEGVTSIGPGAFANCTSLENIYLPETIADMSGWFIFGNCTNLKKVNIPKLVTELGPGCFLGSGIETFIIPKNVTSIGERCFGGDEWHPTDALQRIKICHDSYENGDISFPESMFNDVSGLTLIVPEGTKESLYSQVYPWKNFGNIIEYKDQDDEHQYNNYRVEYEEEVIGHEQEAGDDTTILDYVPSGVDTALPEDTEKPDYVLINWHDKHGNAPHAVMPAQDILLRLTLALLGDANSDGDVDVSDFLSVANYILGSGPASFLHKAANTSKGDDEIDVADFLGVANVILRGVHYSNPHHAPARRTASNTDISTMDNAIYVEPASVCIGLEQTLSVKMKNANPVAGFEFSLQLPEGFTVTGASLSNERTTSAKTSSFSYAVLDDGTVKVLCGTMTQNPETGKLYTFDGNDGEVATITISVDPNMALDNYSAIVTNAKLADADAVKTTISDDVESVITVSDVLVLDENSTVTPPTANNVTVTVKRTINANEWSTICLPFDMTEEQVKTAFGNDVQLAEFSSYDTVKDGDNVTGITINFEDTDLSDKFYANYPYIIKTSSDITEFTLTTNVAPDDAVAEYDNGMSGGKRKVYGSFIGTYKAKTVVPDNSLFLSAGKFWYSAGLTKMKAFRAYFTLDDVLTDMSQASARIQMSLDEEETGVNERAITNHEQPSHEKYYNLMGQRVTMPKKGLLVKEGKKIVVK